MHFFPAALENLIEKLGTLPGVGRKSAQRHAFHIMSLSDSDALSIADAIAEAVANINHCKICFNFTESELCGICTDDKRNKSVICVVPYPKGVLAIERSGEYNGVYHVLHGVLSPSKNISPDDITIKELLDRASAGNITEVIMATDPDITGEVTARHIAKLLSQYDLKVTQLAYGIPVGGVIEYVDDATLIRALDGRLEF